jgi:hypothetical protein
MSFSSTPKTDAVIWLTPPFLGPRRENLRRTDDRRPARVDARATPHAAQTRARAPRSLSETVNEKVVIVRQESLAEEEGGSA